MTKREEILLAIAVAAREGDMAKAQRLYIENRISYAAFQEAIAKGHAGRVAAGKP